jgi:hypothetical protein
MNADDALREMRKACETTWWGGPEREQVLPWIRAIEAELKALREKVAMLEAKGGDAKYTGCQYSP